MSNFDAAVQPICSPWRTTLLDALKGVQHKLLMVSPYIKAEVVTAMKAALVARSGKEPIEVRVITRVDAEDLLSGSSDILALQQLLSWSGILAGSSVEMRAIPNVHAKVWVCDTQQALVGSGNATPSGLDNNLEYGLAISDQHLIERILQDWQPYWDQASLVDAAILEQMRQWLQEAEQSNDLHQIKEQQQAVKRKLRSAPHIGRRIVPSNRSADTKKIKEVSVTLQPPTSTTELQGYTAIPATSHMADQESINCAAHDLWQALCWALPIDDEIQISSPLYRSAFLKLSLIPTSAEHQTLQFIWADGKRYTQATIACHTSIAQQSWTSTFNIEQIRMLGEMLQPLKQKGMFSASSQTTLQLRLERSPHRLSIFYLRNAAINDTGADISIPCIPAATPGNFPALRRPVSQITIEHMQLVKALDMLQQYAPNIIEISLGTPGIISSITLSTGQITNPITISIPGKDCELNGPGINLRVDFAAVQHVVTSTFGRVSYWQLHVDRYAEAVQFIPEMQAQAAQNISLIWRHELRNM